MNQTKGFLALVLAAAILGTFGVFIRELAGAFSDSGQVFARSFFATIIIAFIVFYKRINPLNIGGKNLRYALAFSLVFSLSILCFTISANLIKVTNSLFMLYVGSLVSTAIFGRIIFQEKFTLKHIAALVLVFVGLGFFVYPFNIGSTISGLAIGLFAGIFEGSSHTMRKLMADIPKEVVVFYQAFSGVILASVILIVSKEVFIKELHPSSIFVAFLFGLLLVSVGYLLVYGFNSFDVNWGAIILATELFFAIIINALFLKEYPTAQELFGGLLIFSGTVITALRLDDASQNQSSKCRTEKRFL